MCQSPNSSVVRRTIDLKYSNKKRASSLRWLLFNGALLAVLAYDLWVWCGCDDSLAWLETAAACVLAGSCAAHAARLASRDPRYNAPSAALSPTQRRLLGLTNTDLEPTSRSPSPVPVPVPVPSVPELVSSPSSLWSRRAADASPPSPASPAGAGSGAGHTSADDFISDGRALAAYIRQAEAETLAAAEVRVRIRPRPHSARPHQLAPLPDRNKESNDEDISVSPGTGTGAPLWRRLHVDPRRLTEYNLNLRLWLHVTVVSRVARELEAAGAGAGAGAGARHDALLPFLRPFADTQYVAERIKELSRGGCLSAYRWDSGGRGWSPPRPTDAELVLHLFVTYMDLLAGGAFSARHVSGTGPLALRRVRTEPPHYVLQLEGETLDVGSGRDNLLHTLLLFLAAAARADGAGPPALCRLHLGPASLNMLWILGR